MPLCFLFFNIILKFKNAPSCFVFTQINLSKKYAYTHSIKLSKHKKIHSKEKKYHSNYKRTKLAHLTESRDSLQPLTTNKKDTPIGMSFLCWAEVDSNPKEKRGIPLFSRLSAFTANQQPKICFR
jgi:hypothetical protein